MIERTQGDILQADAEALVNTVNCVGYMGRGIAAQFKRAFPQNFERYRSECKRGAVRPGQMLIVETGELTGPKYIINFPTKRHWRGKSRIEDIEAGLRALVRDVARLRIQSIAIPPLGCGLGGLSWSEVRPRIEHAFLDLPDVHVRLYEPTGAPAHIEMVRAANVPEMTKGRAVLVSLMERYLAGLLDPFISLLEVHKLMYFAQEAGEELQLRFKPAHYGPYAENLRHVLAAIEGYFVSGYSDGGDEPGKPLALVPGAVEEAAAILADVPEVQERFARVADLVDGFENPSSLELLATIHWLATHEGVRDPEAMLERVHRWNKHKRQFTLRQVDIALDALHSKGWLRAAAPA